MIDDDSEIPRQKGGTTLAPAAAMHASDLPPPEARFHREELLRYLLVNGPPTTNGEELLHAIEEAEGAGMPTWKIDGRTIYDRRASIDWLYHHSAAHHEPEILARRDGRRGWSDWVTRGAQHANGALRLVRGTERRHRVRLSFVVELADLPSRVVRAFVPLPSATFAQDEVDVVDVHPPPLADAISRELGWIYGAELRPTGSVLHVTTTFDVRVAPVWTEGLGEPPEIASTLEDALRRAANERLPHRRAWVIYRWMMAHGRWARSAPPCLCTACCGDAFARERAGHCIVHAHAFLDYCARVGVRGRPVRGRLFTFPRGENRFHYAAWAEPVLGHTWAEIDLGDVGWMPIEHHALVFRSTTERNCREESLRRELEAERSTLERAFFGGLDGDRVTYPESCAFVPPFLVHDARRPRGERWTPIDPRRISSSHDVEVLS